MPTGIPTITRREFGQMPDGRPVHEYTLDNGAGMTLSAINFGGIVTSIRVPDRERRTGNVVLGFATLAEYLAHNPNCGTIVGRYANRIAGGRLVLDGEVHQLDLNDGPNCLHGGMHGFGKRWWSIAPQPHGADGSVALELGYSSEHGEGGFPGRLQASVRYTLLAGAQWRVDYRATTDRPTVVNLSHHDYFNLAGCGSALAHRLTLAASRYTPVDRHLIPTGIAAVEGTPFDFREARAIEERIRGSDPQLALRAATTTTGCWTGPTTARWLSRRGSKTPLRAACWRSTPPSRRCSSTRAINWTAACWAPVASCTVRAMACAWSRNTAPTRPTSRALHPPCWGRAMCLSAARCTGSA